MPFSVSVQEKTPRILFPAAGFPGGRFPIFKAASGLSPTKSMIQQTEKEGNQKNCLPESPFRSRKDTETIPPYRGASAQSAWLFVRGCSFRSCAGLRNRQTACCVV